MSSDTDKYKGMAKIPELYPCNLKMTDDLRKLIQDKPSIILRDVAGNQCYNIDTQFFTKEAIQKKHMDMKVRPMIQNQNAKGFDVESRKLQQYQQVELKLQQYVQYQSKYNDRSWVKKQPYCKLIQEKGWVLFGVNIDMVGDSWSQEVEHLHSKLPKCLMPRYKMDMLSYSKQEVLGVNTLQMYMKIPGVWTGGHQENLGVRAVNINFGPGKSEWITIDQEHVPQFRKQVLQKYGVDIHKQEGLWYVYQNDIDFTNIQAKYTVQKPGDIIVLGPGTLHWVRSVGDKPSIQVAHNLMYKSLWDVQTMIYRYNVNRDIKFTNLLKIKSLFLDFLINEYSQHDRKFIEYMFRQLQQWIYEEDQKSEENKQYYPDSPSIKVPKFQLLLSCTYCAEELFNHVYECKLCVDGVTQGSAQICVDCIKSHKKKCGNEQIVHKFKYKKTQLEALMTRIEIYLNPNFYIEDLDHIDDFIGNTFKNKNDEFNSYLHEKQHKANQNTYNSAFYCNENGVQNLDQYTTVSNNKSSHCHKMQFAYGNEGNVNSKMMVQSNNIEVIDDSTHELEQPAIKRRRGGGRRKSSGQNIQKKTPGKKSTQKAQKKEEQKQMKQEQQQIDIQEQIEEQQKNFMELEQQQQSCSQQDFSDFVHISNIQNSEQLIKSDFIGAQDSQDQCYQSQDLQNEDTTKNQSNQIDYIEEELQSKKQKQQEEDSKNQKEKLESVQELKKIDGDDNTIIDKGVYAKTRKQSKEFGKIQNEEQQQQQQKNNNSGKKNNDKKLKQISDKSPSKKREIRDFSESEEEQFQTQSFNKKSQQESNKKRQVRQQKSQIVDKQTKTRKRQKKEDHEPVVQKKLKTELSKNNTSQSKELIKIQSSEDINDGEKNIKNQKNNKKNAMEILNQDLEEEKPFKLKKKSKPNPTQLKIETDKQQSIMFQACSSSQNQLEEIVEQEQQDLSKEQKNSQEEKQKEFEIDENKPQSQNKPYSMLEDLLHNPVNNDDGGDSKNKTDQENDKQISQQSKEEIKIQSSDIVSNNNSKQASQNNFENKQQTEEIQLVYKEKDQKIEEELQLQQSRNQDEEKLNQKGNQDQVIVIESNNKLQIQNTDDKANSQDGIQKNQKTAGIKDLNKSISSKNNSIQQDMNQKNDNSKYSLNAQKSKIQINDRQIEYMNSNLRRKEKQSNHSTGDDNIQTSTSVSHLSEKSHNIRNKNDDEFKNSSSRSRDERKDKYKKQYSLKKKSRSRSIDGERKSKKESKHQKHYHNNEKQRDRQCKSSSQNKEKKQKNKDGGMSDYEPSY